MKKIILAIIVVVIVFAFTFPIYADKPADPGANGLAMSETAQIAPGNLAEAIALAKDTLVGPDGFKNIGQIIQEFKSSWGIPPKHTS